MTLKTHPTEMSSDGLEHASWTPRSPRDRILMALKMHDTLSSAALGTMLGTTGEAVRQQLGRLADEGLVSAVSRPGGVGRPTQSWSLTAAAQARFPDTHAALTVQLLGIVQRALGDHALDTIISAREAETREAYETALADRLTLADKVAALADIRSSEGYMAGWRAQADGTLLLVENHCPICAAATACQGFCRAELAVFQAVLGPGVAVKREEHIVSGGRRCSYVIGEVAGE